MATRPRTVLWGLAWDRLRAALSGVCPRRNGNRRKLARHQIACCYDGSGAPLADGCLTTWALTDAVVRPAAEELALNESLSLYCLQARY